MLRNLVASAFFSTLMVVSARVQAVEPINDLFNRAINNSSGTFYDITSISGQANIIFGWRSWPGSYPENQITQDAQTVEILTKDVMDRQDHSLPVRTRDLANPYTTSVIQNPSYTSPR
jgi:hypothetical protein